MTTDELLAECRAARPEMEWTVEGFMVMGARFGKVVRVCRNSNGVRAAIGSNIANAPTAADALDMLRTLMESVCDLLEDQLRDARNRRDVLVAPLPQYRCAACAWPLAQSRADGCAPGDCCRRGGDRGPHNPIEPKRYARERSELRP